MYRGKLWTMRQFAGFGTAKETNERFRSPRPRADRALDGVRHALPDGLRLRPPTLARRGRAGVVAIDSLEDMETLFSGIPPAGLHLDDDQLHGADRAGVLRLCRRGAGRPAFGAPRNHPDGHPKEYIAQKEWIYPPEPSMRLVIDMVEFCAREMPVVPDLHLRLPHPRGRLERTTELAFALMNRFTYVEAAIERGLDVDDFAPRLSFFFNAHLDFLEEIAKYRAARRIWARELRERATARRTRARG